MTPRSADPNSDSTSEADDYADYTDEGALRQYADGVEQPAVAHRRAGWHGDEV
jgi:hypothetical protein